MPTLSRILYIPLGLGTAFCLLLTYYTGNTFYNYIAAPFFLGLVINFIMSPQVDWWYYERNPPQIDEGTQQFLETRLPFYKNLDEAGKQRFGQRMAMWAPAHEFIPMQLESLPEEIQAALSASAVQLTFGQKDYLLEKFEKVIIYPGTFLSPNFTQHLHSSEIHAEDGGFIFSARHLMHGFVDPKSFYNSALHECSCAWMQLNPNRAYPKLPDDIWDTLTQISGFPKANVLEWFGLPEVDVKAVSICYFFMFSEKFQELAPELYKGISELLNLNPLEGEQPILYVNLA